MSQQWVQQVDEDDIDRCPRGIEECKQATSREKGPYAFEVAEGLRAGAALHHAAKHGIGESLVEPSPHPHQYTSTQCL